MRESALPVPEVDGQNARLKKAADLVEAGEYDRAWAIADAYLGEVDPNNVHALLICAMVLEKARNLPQAYQYCKRVTEISPRMGTGWLNLGRVAAEMFYFDEATRCNEKALSSANTYAAKSLVYVNWGCMAADSGDFKEAERMSRLAIQFNPDTKKGRANLGIALLGQRKWAEGWPLYDEIIGFDESRKRIQYGEEPEWDGTDTERLVVYGEQGLGDEIMFSSMIPSVTGVKRLVLDVDHRLQHLFQRSFPNATVYGTRWKKGQWNTGDQTPTASISIGGLGKYLRNTNESFPGTPYLVPDPIRGMACRAVVRNTKKPVVGIAWTGGVQWTGAKFRRMTLQDMLPIFRSVDAHFVCLQYKNASSEIEEFVSKHPEIDLKQYPYWTLTEDYDDTAALVSVCDAVVCMQTSVGHLAGALGVPAIVFVNKHSQWRYGENDSMPWYKSVQLLRQRKEGSYPVLGAAEMLKALL